eukprot:2294758-Lingulodinium_polyedra.AAC.1
MADAFQKGAENLCHGTLIHHPPLHCLYASVLSITLVSAQLARVVLLEVYWVRACSGFEGHGHICNAMCGLASGHRARKLVALAFFARACGDPRARLCCRAHAVTRVLGRIAVHKLPRSLGFTHRQNAGGLEGRGPPNPTPGKPM